MIVFLRPDKIFLGLEVKRWLVMLSLVLSLLSIMFERD